MAFYSFSNQRNIFIISSYVISVLPHVCFIIKERDNAVITAKQCKAVLSFVNILFRPTRLHNFCHGSTIICQPILRLKKSCQRFCSCKGSAWSFSLALQRKIKTFWQLGQCDTLDNYQAPN